VATKFDSLLLAKIEVTKGLDPVPVPADNAIRIISAVPAVTIDNIERPIVKPTMGQLAHLMGKRMIVLTIELELRGSGAAGTAPDYGVLLRACGLDETIVVSTSVAYDPLTASLESVTIYWYEDGLLWKLKGSVGDLAITYAMNSQTRATITMSAPYEDPTTVAKPGGEVYQTTPPIVASAADVISEAAGEIKVGAFDLALANDVQEHYTSNQHEFTVAERQPTFKLTKDSVSTIVDWTALAAGTDVALSAVVDGGAGNKITITGDYGRRKTIAGGTRAERFTRDIEYGLYESAGDDQLQLLLE
jgi:hypothetical protein